VDRSWVSEVAFLLDIPFCVAGGIKSVADAEDVLNKGADKISINSPALADPDLITRLALRFGSQCVVLGIDSREEDASYRVYQYSGDPNKTTAAERSTIDWVSEVQDRGAGEIVLNCMNQDGVRRGYDNKQLKAVRSKCGVPLIASGGAGDMDHFYQTFTEANVDGALAASVFHSAEVNIGELKQFLAEKKLSIRI
jgi:cyclase